jgi:LysM repeat protein
VIAGGILSLVVFRVMGDQGKRVADNPTPSVAPTPSPTPTATQTVNAETPTPAITATLAPYEYEVQAGDTLYYIIQLFGYRDTGVVPEVLALNGLPNVDAPLVAGQTLLIPRQTPTVGPTFTPSMTQDPLLPTNTLGPTGTSGPTIDPNLTVVYENCTPENRCASPDGQFWIHIVQSGDTIAYIAFAYNSTVDCVLRENGLSRETPIFEGQQIKVCILVTLTPTLTPTGGPDSTATPTPTPASPSLLAPRHNASIPRGESVILQWTAVHPLAPGQYYLIVLKSSDSGEETRFVTRSNSYRLPERLRPGIGSSIEYEWRVVIISSQNPDAPSISGAGSPRLFTWGG